MGLGIGENELSELLEESNIEDNPFYKSILKSKQEIFRDTNNLGLKLYKAPKYFKNDREFTLAKYLDIFDRDYIE